MSKKNTKTKIVWKEKGIERKRNREVAGNLVTRGRRQVTVGDMGRGAGLQMGRERKGRHSTSQRSQLSNSSQEPEGQVALWQWRWRSRAEAEGRGGCYCVQARGGLGSSLRGSSEKTGPVVTGPQERPILTAVQHMSDSIFRFSDWAVAAIAKCITRHSRHGVPVGLLASLLVAC